MKLTKHTYNYMCNNDTPNKVHPTAAMTMVEHSLIPVPNVLEILAMVRISNGPYIVQTVQQITIYDAIDVTLVHFH